MSSPTMPQRDSGSGWAVTAPTEAAVGEAVEIGGDGGDGGGDDGDDDEGVAVGDWSDGLPPRLLGYRQVSGVTSSARSPARGHGRGRDEDVETRAGAATGD